MAKAESLAVSFNPADMLEGGLKDDFRGKILEAAYGPWDYDGKIPEPVLALRLSIQAEDEDKPFVQHWSAGDLANFWPSEDGRTKADEGEFGPYVIRIGKRAGLNNNTNLAHLMQAILDAGAASGKFGTDDLTTSIECLVGLDAQWNRVEQRKRSGMTDNADGQPVRKRDILVVTEVYGYRDEKPAKKGKPAKATAKAAPVQPEEDEEDEPEVDDLTVTVQGHVSEAISDAGGTIKKGKLPNEILKRMAKDPQKTKAVKLVTQADFLEDDDAPWSYDADTGVLTEA